jgi:hypothetical protein
MLLQLVEIASNIANAAADLVVNTEGAGFTLSVFW